MSEQAGDLATSRPSNAGQKGPKRLLDDKDFWKIYEKGETIGRGHFAKVKLVRHRSRRDLRPPALNRGSWPSRPVREGGPRGPARPLRAQTAPCDPRDPRPASCANRIADLPASTTPAPIGSGAFSAAKILNKGLEEHKEDYESMMREFQVTRPSHRARDHSAVEGC